MKTVFKTIVMTFCLCTVAFTSKTMAQDVDVYVVGDETVVTPAEGGGTSTVRYAKVWKNGVEAQSFNGNASSVYVAGNDVYVAGNGYKINPRGELIRFACIWKNGDRTDLTGANNKDAYAKSIFVSGNDVYVAGNEKYGNGTALIDKIDVAKVWRNGVETVLGNSAFPRSVYVSGNDVYVAGYADDGDDRNGKSQAVFWKNGVITFLTDGTNAASAYSIYVSGNDVYIAGYEYDGIGGHSIAKVWRNRIATNLPTDGTVDVFAYSVFVSENDVYVTGNQMPYPTAKYWKNDVETNLPKEKSFAYGRSIFVQGEDVYIAGYERSVNEKEIATLWKNNVATSLTDGTNAAIAQSVFVVPKSTGIDDVQVSKDIHVYPNPARDELKIIVDNDIAIDAVEICDVLGRKMLNAMPSNCKTINVSSLSQGIYVVKIHTPKGLIVKKFLKE